MMTPADWTILQFAFKRTCDHFNLPEEIREVAWSTARECPVKALACYSAIANSLKGRK